MKKETLWLTRTALMTALLIALQFATRGLGQLVTGSCVNLILSLAVLSCGFWSGFTVALLSPFFAFFLGIGPALIALVPAISLGNLVLVALLHLAGKWAKGRPAGAIVGAVIASLGKFLALFLLVARLLVPLLGLPEAKAAAMTAMFSWPQLATALIGSLCGSLIAPRLRPRSKQ